MVAGRFPPPRRAAAHVLFVCALAATPACHREEGKPKQGAAPPPPIVTVAPAEQRDVPVSTEYVGVLDGYINTEIRARVAGYLLEQKYREGSFVDAGTLLFTIDPREYQAAVERARAAVMSARAANTNACAQVKRLEPLVPVNAVSRQDYDTAVANQLQAEAQVHSTLAALETAQLNLSYTKISTPISGIVGTALVRTGNLVGQGSPTLLTVVSQVDPVRARFGIPERDYLDYVRRTHRDGGTAMQPRLELILADGTRYPADGELVFTDRAVDPTTGTLSAEALFPNPERILRPGQYGRVRLTREVLHGAVVIPQVAVNPLQNLSMVGVVDDRGVLHVRRVETGPAIDSGIVIRSGVQPGEKVVVEGFGKAKDGQQVNAQPAAATQAPPGPGIGGSGAPPR